MESDDCEIVEISEADCIKRKLRRRSSIYGSPLVPSTAVAVTDKKELLYVAQLKNEKMQWIKLQDKIIEESKKNEELPTILGDTNFLNTELKDFCNGGPDMKKFATDAKTFFRKFEFYMKMENYHAQKLKYAEDRLKEKVDEAVTKIYVDEIEEKMYHLDGVAFK